MKKKLTLELKQRWFKYNKAWNYSQYIKRQKKKGKKNTKYPAQEMRDVFSFRGGKCIRTETLAGAVKQSVKWDSWDEGWIDLPKVICTSLPKTRALVKLAVRAVDWVAMCGHTPTPLSVHRQIHSVLGVAQPRWPEDRVQGLSRPYLHSLHQICHGVARWLMSVWHFFFSYLESDGLDKWDLLFNWSLVAGKYVEENVLRNKY